MTATLEPSEPHPAVNSARAWYVQNMTMEKEHEYLESFSSCAIEGNRLAEICAETLRKLMHGETVSDRYFLGLAWTLRDMEEQK